MKRPDEKGGCKSRCDPCYPDGGQHVVFKTNPYFVFSQDFALQNKRVPFSVSDDPRRRRGGKLETDIPDDLRVECAQKNQSDAKSVQTVGFAFKQKPDLYDGEHKHRTKNGEGASGGRRIKEHKKDGADAGDSVGHPGRFQ